MPYDPWNSPVLLGIPGDTYYEELYQSLIKALVERQDVAGLHRVRCALADEWLTTPDDSLPVVFHAPLGRAQEMAIQKGIFRMEPEGQDQSYILLALSNLRSGLGSVWAIQYLLSAMLFCPAHELPMRHDLKLIPQWLLPLNQVSSRVVILTGVRVTGTRVVPVHLRCQLGKVQQAGCRVQTLNGMFQCRLLNQGWSYV